MAISDEQREAIRKAWYWEILQQLHDRGISYQQLLSDPDGVARTLFGVNFKDLDRELADHLRQEFEWAYRRKHAK
jgi:hypothetical protein